MITIALSILFSEISVSLFTLGVTLLILGRNERAARINSRLRSPL